LDSHSKWLLSRCTAGKSPTSKPGLLIFKVPIFEYTAGRKRSCLDSKFSI